MDEPQYKKLARVLLQKIHSGEYAVGAQLPTEHDLCQIFETSRHTVREALRQLQLQGLVSRRAGVGTRVLAREASSSYQQSLASIEDLVQFGATNIRVVKGLRKNHIMDSETAVELDCRPGSRWMWLGTVRMDCRQNPPVPVCWTDNYVDPSYKDIGPEIRTSPSTLLCTLIEQRYGQRVLKVAQTVSASVVGSSVSAVLNVASGTPALRVIRHYYDELGKVFIVTNTVHPGTQYRFNMVLVRTKRK